MSKFLPVMAYVVAAALTGHAANAAAQCCPSGGSGVPQGKTASTGLGEAAPAAANLSVDPAWSVYQFQRDGITYLQINDARGNVRAAVGRIGDTAWVMPMGRDVDAVTIASSATAGAVVYSSADFVVRVVSGANGVSWMIVPLRTN